MFNYLITIVLIISTTVTTLTSASGQLVATATLSEGKIKSVEPRGIVTPNRCGGPGTYVSLGITDCTQFPCTLTGNTRVDLTFITSRLINNPSLRYIITPKSGSPVSDYITVSGGPFPAFAEVIATLRSFAGPFLTKDVNIQLEVMNDNRGVEICVDGEFNPSGSNNAGIISSSVIALTISSFLVSYYSFY